MLSGKKQSWIINKGKATKVLVKIVKKFELYPEGNGDSIKYFKHGTEKMERTSETAYNITSNPGKK